MGAQLLTLTPELLLNAYASGYFPMAESRHGRHIHWYYPEQRGILPLDAFHVPRSLSKFMRRNPFTLTTDKAFPQVIRGCAELCESRQQTWINDEIISLYETLWRKGFAHSIECWQGDRLAGGIYGVAIGGAFFGESMFSRQPNASKVALVHLVRLLQEHGYGLLDTQFVNEHLKQFGVLEIPRQDYLNRLHGAIMLTPPDCF
jgi:leucyl/phenylalanyl-tRNA---protein transferase